MAQVPVRGVHISAPLSNLSVGYHPVGFVAEQLTPVVSVINENDVYYVWDRDDALREIESLRADGTRSNTVDYGFSKAAYVAEEYALNFRVTERQMRNADSPLQLQVSKMRRIQDTILMGQERRVRGLFTTSTLPSGNQATLSGANQWNNGSFVGSIEQNIDTGTEAIRIAIGGLSPNRLLTPKAVAKVMKRDSKIRDLVKYTHADLLVDGELPPTLWGLSVLIPSASSITSVENPSVTASPADIWGKDVLITYTTPTPALDIISAGYIIRSQDWVVRSWQEEEVRSTFYEPSVVQDEKLVASIAAYIIAAAIA